MHAKGIGARRRVAAAESAALARVEMARWRRGQSLPSRSCRPVPPEDETGRYGLATGSLACCCVEKYSVSCAWKPPPKLQGNGHLCWLSLQIQRGAISAKAAWILGFCYISVPTSSNWSKVTHTETQGTFSESGTDSTNYFSVSSSAKRLRNSNRSIWDAYCQAERQIID